MKKINILFLFIIVGVVFSSCIRKNIVSVEQELVDIFNGFGEEFNLYYIGKREEFLNLKVTYVDSIENIPFNNNHKYTFLVINNLDESLAIAADELIGLKEKIVENKYSFYYFGRKYINLFYEAGLYDSNFIQTNLLAFAYVYHYGKHINSVGFWDYEHENARKENNLIFLTIILYSFERVIKTNT